MFNALMEKGNRVMRGVVNLLPAFLCVCFYVLSASSNVPPDQSRKIIFLIVCVLLTTHLYLHNNILKVLVYYCVANLFLIQPSNVNSFPYLITIWSIAMFSSFIYRVNRDFKYWGWTLIAIYLINLYCILARKFGWYDPYYVLTNVRHLHYTQYAGAFTHTIYQGIYSAMLVPISLVLAPILIIPQLITLWLAHCSIGVFALLFSFCVFLFRVKPKSLFIAAPLLLITFYLYSSKYDGASVLNFFNEARVEFWIKLIKYEGFSLLGKGLGSFNQIRGLIPAVNPINNAELNNAHNFLVQWYYQAGVIGLLLFISYPIYISYRYLCSKCSLNEHMLYASCLTSFICAMWQPSWSVIEIGAPTIILSTLLERSFNHGKVERENEVEYIGESDQASCCSEREVCCSA